MVTLTGLRTEVADMLTAAGINADHYVAEVLAPPVAVVAPGDPYLTLGEPAPFGHYNVNLSVLLVGSKGTHKAAAEAVDALIEQVVAALDSDWEVTSVTQPGQVNLNGSAYLGAVLSIEQITKLGGQ